jgi:hypothetical protein
MALDYRVTEVPEGLESYYKEDNDGYVLDVKGAVDTSAVDALKTEAEEYKSKVKEFREHNIKLRQQVEQASTSTGDDPPPNIDELINDAVSEMRSEMDKINSERNTLMSQLEEVVLSDRVKDIAIRHGVHETALPDVVTRAKGVFTVKDGKPVPADKKSRDESGELYTPETWLKKLEEDAPHLFKSSSGSGAHRPVNGARGAEPALSSTQKIAAGLGSMSGHKAKDVM